MWIVLGVQSRATRRVVLVVVFWSDILVGVVVRDGLVVVELYVV